MAIKRNSCRITERKRMRVLEAKGFSLAQISNAVSVRENIVAQVLDGSWAAAEAVGKKQQAANNKVREGEKQQQKIDDATLVATAVARALQPGGVNADPAPAPLDPLEDDPFATQDADEPEETKGKGKKSAAK